MAKQTKKKTWTGLKMSEKAANVQGKAFKTIAPDHFKRFQENLAAWKQNIKKISLAQHLTEHTVLRNKALLLCVRFCVRARHKDRISLKTLLCL